MPAKISRKVDPMKAASSRGTAWPLQKKAEAITLHAQGMAMRDVELLTGMPDATLYRWLANIERETLSILGMEASGLKTLPTLQEKLQLFQVAFGKVLASHFRALDNIELNAKERKDLTVAAAIAYDKLVIAAGLPTARTETAGRASKEDVLSALRVLYQEAQEKKRAPAGED
jgi:hypothetical protein